MKKVNQDTFTALEWLLPKKEDEFLQNISWLNSQSIAKFIKADERSYKALSIPLWEILDRGGKGWRSYILQVSCESTGHQFSAFKNWLALPEIMHVGSLVIDDIQDSSEIRRGGKACHLIFGVEVTINAGTFAYFIGQKLIEHTEVNELKKLALYREYMSLLREAHIGQALDIEGLNILFEDLGSSPDSAFDAVLDIHLRKSGIVAKTCARMGAILGGGTDRQIEVLGEFFEEIGTLFQVRDDILNITGYQYNLKERFEDLKSGKITLPVAIALQSLPGNARELILHLLESKNKDSEYKTQYLLTLIDSSNSIELCHSFVEKRYDQAFERLKNSQCDFSNLENIDMFSKYLLDIHD